jgi:hypothetical protein
MERRYSSSRDAPYSAGNSEDAARPTPNAPMSRRPRAKPRGRDGDAARTEQQRRDQTERGPSGAGIAQHEVTNQVEQEVHPHPGGVTEREESGAEQA